MNLLGSCSSDDINTSNLCLEMLVLLIEGEQRASKFDCLFVVPVALQKEARLHLIYNKNLIARNANISSYF